MSSSSESTAPLDYHISSSCEDNSKLVIITEDCPLCLKASRNFYCKTCLKHGEFVHSNGKSCEMFSDKRMRFLILHDEKRKTEKLCEQELSNNIQLASVKGDIEEFRDRNSFLKVLIEEKKRLIFERKQKINKLKGANLEKRTRLNRYEERVQKLKSFVDVKQSELKALKNTLEVTQEDLKKKRRIHIKQLVSYIFPISIIEPASNHDDDSTVSALEDACHTAFIQGKWLSPKFSAESQHRIVAPTLPASGNYSAYNDWLAANKDCVPSASSNTNVDFNPAYNISAALTYTTQLVNMLAYYLDVRLPAKLCYSDFCSNELGKGKFMKKVARLNWNVLHLCFSQNVNPSLLKPESTLANILLLLDQTVSDLGRSLTPDVNPEESRVLEDALRPLLEVDDPDDSGDEGLSYDWEAVPSSSGLPESEPVQNIQSQQISSTSVAGGLITSTAASLVSFLRWNR